MRLDARNEASLDRGAQSALHCDQWARGGRGNGEVKIGRVRKKRAKQFRFTTWIPIGKIVDPVRYERWTTENRSMFYAEAWLLVHYLFSGPEDVPPFNEGMASYIELVEGGSPPRKAFEQAFRIPMNKLDQRVRDYADDKGTGLSISEEDIPHARDVRIRSLSESEVAESLAVLVLAVGNLPEAERLFETALVGQPDFAEWRHRAALEIEDSAERHEGLRDARRHYVKANELRPDAPETLSQPGATFLADGEDPSKGLDALVRAHDLLPSDLSIRSKLAQIYLANDQPERALPHLKSIAAWSHGSEEGAAAGALVSEIEAAQAGPDEVEPRVDAAQ